MDYTPYADKALAIIERKGGPIEFMVYPSENPPDDEDKPWEGSNTEREPFPHKAVLIPLTSLFPNLGDDMYGEGALIPAKGLTFPLFEGTQFRTANTNYNIDKYNLIRPDGVTPILYICRVTTWPRV